jgi:indole-3-glycerol phosphate synthase
MARGSARRVVQATQRESEAELRRRAAATPPSPTFDLEGRGFDVIAEIKRRAPSSGPLSGGKEATSVAGRAAVYAAAGAAAISVLTEPEEFGGSIDDLSEAAGAVRVPVMRKDFLVDPYQIFEARAAGAGGALLILRMLDEPRMAEMLDAVAEAGMFVLLEVFGADDLARAGEVAKRSSVSSTPLLIGLNSRDLSTLEVDLERFRTLRSRLPAGFPCVAESGLETIDDVRQVASLGYRAALVGSALMRSVDPGRLLARMIRVGREEASRSCAFE